MDQLLDEGWLTWGQSSRELGHTRIKAPPGPRVHPFLNSIPPTLSQGAKTIGPSPPLQGWPLTPPAATSPTPQHRSRPHPHSYPLLRPHPIYLPHMQGLPLQACHKLCPQPPAQPPLKPHMQDLPLQALPPIPQPCKPLQALSPIPQHSKLHPHPSALPQAPPPLPRAPPPASPSPHPHPTAPPPSGLHPHTLSWRLASAQLGSLPRRIMTACMTVSTSPGGRPYDLISVMSFLFSDSSACRAGDRVCGGPRGGVWGGGGIWGGGGACNS